MDNEIKKQIGQRINSLLAIRGIKQKELAKYLGVTDNTISYFCKGVRTPNTEQIIKIADFLNTSTDYLLCRNEVISSDINIKSICEYTGLSEKALNEIKKCNRHISAGYFDGAVSEEYEFIDALNYLLESDNFYGFIQPLSCVYKYCKPNLKIDNEKELLCTDEINEFVAKIDEFCYKNNCKLVSNQELAELKLSYAQAALLVIFDELIHNTFQDEED